MFAIDLLAEARCTVALLLPHIAASVIHEEGE
jgi:hypothetical protein